jgi:hypothetical protein
MPAPMIAPLAPLSVVSAAAALAAGLTLPARSLLTLYTPLAMLAAIHTGGQPITGTKP